MILIVPYRNQWDKGKRIRFKDCVCLANNIPIIYFRIKLLLRTQRTMFASRGAGKILFFITPNIYSRRLLLCSDKIKSFIVILLTFHRFYALPNIAGFMPKNDNDWQWIPSLLYSSAHFVRLTSSRIHAKRAYILQSFH